MSAVKAAEDRASKAETRISTAEGNEVSSKQELEKIQKEMREEQKSNAAAIRKAEDDLRKLQLDKQAAEAELRQKAEKDAVEIQA